MKLKFAIYSALVAGLFLSHSALAVDDVSNGMGVKPDVIALVHFVIKTESPQIKEPVSQSSIDFFSGLKSIGLKHKYYTHGNKAGQNVGVYLWDSREQANAFYNKKWRAKMKEKTLSYSIEILDMVVSLNVETGVFTR